MIFVPGKHITYIPVTFAIHLLLMIHTSIQRKSFLAACHFPAALFIVVVMACGCSGSTDSSKTDSSSAAAPATDDIQPASGKATLTLADGARIELGHASDGKLADQGNGEVIKVADAELKYQAGSAATKKDVVAGTNTVQTPKGGRYHITMADGTQVWLNAASTITYPATASGSRNIQLKGEAYFEVNKKAKQPFVVTINDVSVEVLGTRFNVNAYGDEQLVNITLLQGALMIKEGIAIEQMKSGQQAQVSKTRDLNIVSSADTTDAIAWKNGFFSFDHHSLETNLRQISRWYDVSVAFEGSQPVVALSGKIERNISLSSLIGQLSKMGLKTRLEPNRRLLVLKP